MGDVILDQRPWQGLAGKVVLVTGASSGIGRDLCLDLAMAGCKIVAAARRSDRLITLSAEIDRLLSSSTADQPHSAVVSLDLNAEGPAIEASVQRAWEAFGRIDVLVNNAGVRGNVHSPLDLPEDEWDSTFKTNLTGTWIVSKFVCRRMRAANIDGSIINISSVAGLNRGHLPGGVAYASSKAGLNTMTKVMALEFGSYNIRVNSICPGIFSSEITENLFSKKWLNKVVEKIVPLRTLGTKDPALTSLVRYLMHDSSCYITGNIFIVEAGITLPGVPIFSSL